MNIFRTLFIAGVLGTVLTMPGYGTKVAIRAHWDYQDELDVSNPAEDYPFCYEHIDMGYGGGDANAFNAPLTFPEYYIGWEEGQMDTNPHSNHLVQWIITYGGNLGQDLYGLKISREAMYEQYPPGPILEDERILYESDIPAIRQVLKDAKAQGILARDDYKLIQMVTFPKVFATNSRAQNIVKMMDGICYEVHHFNNHLPLYGGRSDPREVVEGALWTLSNTNMYGQPLEYVFYYGPYQGYDCTGITEDPFYTWLEEYWAWGLPKIHPHMIYDMNAFKHACGASRPGLPESDPYSVTGCAKWLIEQVKGIDNTPLFEADFSGGTPGAQMDLSWLINDPMFTLNERVTYYGGLVNFWGGLVGAGNWYWSADGEAITCSDLFVASNGGGTTRIDVKLDKAVEDVRYSISHLVVTLAGTVTNDIHFGFRYKVDGVDHPGRNTVIPNGSSGSFTLDLSMLNLVATDADTSWDVGSTIVEFFEPDGENTDWIAIDSLSIHGAVEEQIGPVASSLWSFDSLGDLEGWAQGELNDDIEGLDVRPALSGSESVLSSTNLTGANPQLVWSGAFTTGEDYWTRAVIRARQLDASGNPLPWDSTGCSFEINSLPLDEIGSGDWQVESTSSEWITASLSILDLPSNILREIKLSPVGGTAALNKNFEIDYIDLQCRPTRPEPVSGQLIYNWEFNTPGDAEGFFANEGFSDLTAANSIDGTEGVLTSADQWADDPRLWFNAYPLEMPNGGWDHVEMRMRQLSDNPGEPGVTAIPWESDGTILIFDPVVRNLSDSVEGVTITTGPDNWSVVTIDTSDVTNNPSFIVVDPLGPVDEHNFEIDYVRVYGAIDGYDMWAFNQFLEGADADPAADPDGDTAHNFYEYTFGGNPNDRMSIGLPVEYKLINDSTLEYVYYCRDTPLVHYSLVTKADLMQGNWTNFTRSTITGSAPYITYFKAVTNQIPMDANTGFFKVQAENQE